MTDLEITWLGGNCPVQSEGTVNGKPYYFRARGEHWAMRIGGDPMLEETSEWCREREYGDGPFDAGWMPEDEARKFIEECAADFVAGSPA